ncbi:MAG: hypothetical protein H6R26_981 [Proteobacteria bacterium]|nr:hypothetical protein [Pseudomonadota bacterium]
MMQLLAISRATPRQIEHRGQVMQTGIYKEPVAGEHQVLRLGLPDDCQVDRVNHGGEDKAIYAYTLENHRYWEECLGLSFPFGQWGENFTVSGMPDETVHVGDIFRIGSVVLQVTQPRVPCFKLGIKLGDSAFIARFHHSGRVGFYLRVLEEGVVSAPSPIELLERDAGGLDIRDAMLALSKGPRQREIIERALAVPALSASWRQSLTKRQAAL